MPDIAKKLGVSRGSISNWTRDVPFQPRMWKRPPGRRGPNALQQRKRAEIEALLAEGRDRIGGLSEQEFLIAGTALYAGEGSKTDHRVKFTNSDPRMIAFFCTWLRRFFDIDERRLRVQLYLHEGLDLDAALEFWSGLTGIPRAQFTKPYRAKPDPTLRRTKHPMGCPSVSYACSMTHRRVMGLVHALLGCSAIPG